MALTIEDGTGVAGANSYLTEVEAKALAVDYGVSLPSDATEAETSLRQGYLNLNTNERLIQGERVYQIQTGVFPRNCVYANGFLVGNDVIPDDVKLAQVYAASAIASGVDTNAVDNGQKLSSFNVDGVYSESYQDGSSVKVNSRIQGVYNSLYPYYKMALSGGRNYRDIPVWLV